jgi:error-prone DNA polymerase
MRPPGFVHLHVHSAFSFRDGASRVEDLVSRAAELGYGALALTDHENVGAAVRFARAAEKAGIKPIQGAELTLEGGYHLVLLAENPRGYANLCRLLTRAHLANPRGRACCRLEDLEELAESLIALSGCRKGEIPSLILSGRYREAEQAARRYRGIFQDRFYLELAGTLLPGDGRLNRALMELARTAGIKVCASSNVHYAAREDFPVHDLLTCARLGITLEEVHPERRLNDENYLKSSSEMAELFSWCPEAVWATVEIAERCQPALDFRQKRYPRFPDRADRPADTLLEELVWRGARERYQHLAPEVRERLEKELAVIRRLGYADYFLVVWDVARYARSRGIRCSGRGSAGASAVAYCLGLTDVDPIGRGLAFERFLSLERAEKPDVDLDFDARRRDEVAEYVYRKYGEEKVAAVAVYSTYRARSAARDLGKALGFTEEEIGALAKTLPYAPADAVPEILIRLPELRRGPWRRDKRYRRLFRFMPRLAGLPRFLGTHLGGLVVAEEPLVEVTPLEIAAKGVRVAQFDRDDVEDLNLLKLDLLCLRALSLLEDAETEIRRSEPGFSLENIPVDDRSTYRLLHRGRTVGVFQLESPAQRALQTRLLAENLEDVVASLALIRPGPIKGNMVEPFVARRRGREPVTYPHPKLEPILKKTCGVVLFQEQVIAIASELAGFTPGEADRLRRLMTHSRSLGEMRALGEEFIRRAAERGVEEKAAREIFACLEGYASYGFCEAHAAAFAVTAYRTAYLAAHRPVEFFAALLNNQPMGYYPLDVVVNEAKRRGVRFLLPDINLSGEKFALEGGALRVPLSRVKGMGPAALAQLLAEREKGRFRSLADFCRRVRPDRDLAENLVRCGAFDSLYPHRRALLELLPQTLAAWGQAVLEPEPPADLEDFSPQEKRLMEYEVLGFEVEGHYMSWWRPRLAREGYVRAAELMRLEDGAPVKVAGIPVRPHRPPTRSGRIVVFLSLEDETGLADITVFENTYQKYGHLLFGPEIEPLRVGGTLVRRGYGASVVARWIAPF